MTSFMSVLCEKDSGVSSISLRSHPDYHFNCVSDLYVCSEPHSIALYNCSPMTQSQLNISRQEDSDLVKIISLITRNYKIYIISLSVALVITFLYNHYKIPVYKIKASLMILEDSRRPQGNAVNEYINSELFGLNQGIQNELYVLKSIPVVEQTVKNLDLMVNYSMKDALQHHNSYKSIPIRVLQLQDHVQPVNVRFMVAIHDHKSFRPSRLIKRMFFSPVYIQRKAPITKRIGPLKNQENSES